MLVYYRKCLHDVIDLDHLRTDVYKLLYHRLWYNFHASRHICSYFKAESSWGMPEQTPAAVEIYVPNMQVLSVCQVSNMVVFYV